MEDAIKRHLLVAVDESKAATKAFDWTLENLVKAGDKIHLFNVVPPGQLVVLSTGLVMDEVMENDDETTERVDHARDYLTSTFAVRLEEIKVPYQLEIVKFATDNDSIGSIICKRAEQIGAAAVVLAKHNQSGIKEFFVGSVTSYCTSHCKTPVLVMHVD